VENIFVCYISFTIGASFHLYSLHIHFIFRHISIPLRPTLSTTFTLNMLQFAPKAQRGKGTLLYQAVSRLISSDSTRNFSYSSTRKAHVNPLENSRIQPLVFRRKSADVDLRNMSPPSSRLKGKQQGKPTLKTW
jgi:hypothetical protein